MKIKCKKSSVLFVTRPIGVKTDKFIEIYIVKLLLSIYSDAPTDVRTYGQRDKKDKNIAYERRCE